MPQMTDKMLDGGDAFPHLEFNKIGGGTVSLPDDLAGQWGAVLLYRGHW
ncbi:MAG: peroxiredoxin family protein [Candidatus Tectomicrobia bacterium]|nr:peroxiredoxin family protein [Candidatus Tectomicrobia bacterium]